jgi:aquaporin Z
MNPALTLTYLRLAKIERHDAAFYIAAQIVGGIGGILVGRALLNPILAHKSVNYVVTIPGDAGTVAAFISEAVLAFLMMSMVLKATNTPTLALYTGLFAGTLVFLFITFESPISGMSINPARTLGSAIPSGIWTGLWIYLTAPLLGMLSAAQLFICLKQRPTACPKYFHGNRQRCIFCGHPGSV